MLSTNECGARRLILQLCNIAVLHKVVRVEILKLGKRERNREEAYLCIHHAAYRMSVLEKSNPTVEEIAVAAGVSPRTFFNYYRTKDEAILGIKPPQLTTGQVDLLAQTGRAALFEVVVSVLFDVVRSSVVDPENLKERFEPFRDRPEHKVFMSRHLSNSESLVHDAIVGRFEEQLDGNDETVVESARALTMLAAAVLRFTFISYPDALYSDGTERTRAALAVFKGVMKEMQ